MKGNKKVSPFAAEIAKSLLRLGSIQFNVNSPFTWVSGIKSPIYCDNRMVNSDVEVRRRLVGAFVDILETNFKDAEIIAGMATGGIPLGALIADRMNLPFIYVRSAPKEHGLKRQVEGGYKAGNKVVLIEDHISTGGSSLKGIEGLRKEQLEVIGLISIMTYGFKKANDLFKSEKVNHYSICDLDTVLEVAINEGIINSQEKESILSFKNSQ